MPDTSSKARSGTIIYRIDSLIAASEFAVSAAFLLLLLRLGILPADIYVLVSFIVMLLSALTVGGILIGHKCRSRRMTGRAATVTGAVLTCLFMLLSFYMYKSDAFLKNVGGESEERYGVSVIVMANSLYTELGDLDDKKFGYVRRNESNILKDGVNGIKEEIGALRTIHTDNMSDLAERLFDGDCDAIIIEESQRALLTEVREDFDNKTRVIWNRESICPLAASVSGIDVTADSFNVFLCGSDSRESVDEAALNDLNMIVTVNPVTKQILLTSIPRDYYIELPSYGVRDKLTHAGVYGTAESVRAVEAFTGLKMDFYAKVSFAALVYGVDAMGGIDVESDREFTAWTNPDVHIMKGVNHMDGVTALAYARERYAYEDGDIHRAKNQAQILREAAWKAMSPGILIHYNKLLDALAMGMKTDMSDEQIRALIRMQLEQKAEWEICDYQMNGTGAMSRECYSMWGQELFIMMPDMDTVDEALRYIREFMDGENIGD